MKFLKLFFIVSVVLCACDLQPKIVALPDNVGNFISQRYPTLLADPETQPEIYDSAVTDYGVYASPELYGSEFVSGQDYVLYAQVDDYQMPVQKTDEKIIKSPEVQPKPSVVADDYLQIPEYAESDGYVKNAVVVEPEPKILKETKVDLKEITIQSGDTLYSLSRQYSMPVNDLAVINNLSAPFVLSVGQKIKVPNVKPNVPESVNVANVNKVQTEKTEVKKVEKVNSVQVKKQDVKKVDTVARKTDVKNDKTINVKKMYGGMEDKKVETKVQTEKKKTETKNQKKDDKKSTDNKTENIAPEKKKISSNPNKKLPKIAKMSSSKFSWPVRGTVLSAYGEKANGLFNEGINIKATRGTAVMAAENGVVAYAGNEIKGMGNLVIMQHSDGWMTVYGHLDSMNVKRGSKLSVGQKLGTVGTSGKVDQAQLHFEIRKGTRSYNPTQYLKK
ncbi:MAG: peptidoglycan DD-metalloendopeptidase family protein [Alphaproteobacteria bacterium]